MKTQIEQLTKIIAASQDGNPLKPLTAEVRDGRITSVSDNLNRLLADAINSAMDANDPDQLCDDLQYAATQLTKAWGAIRDKP